MRFQSKYFLPVICLLIALYTLAAYGLPLLKYHDVIDWSWWWISLPWWGGMIAVVVAFFIQSIRRSRRKPKQYVAVIGNIKDWRGFVEHFKWDRVEQWRATRNGIAFILCATSPCLQSLPKNIQYIMLKHAPIRLRNYAAKMLSAGPYDMQSLEEK